MINDSTAQAPQTAPNSFQPTGSGEAVHFLDYWQILYSRKEIVIAVSLLLILTGIVITKRMPRVYEAQAIIEVQRETPDLQLFGQASQRYDPYFLRTQFEIIKSDPVIKAVVDRYNLADELGLAYGWKSTQTETGCRERVVALIKDSTELSIYRDTDLIAINVRLSKPEEPDGEAAQYAKRVANGIAKVFQEHTAQKSQTAVQRALDVLGTKIEEINEEIKASEDRLASVLDANNISLASNYDSGADSIRRQIMEMKAQADQARMKEKVKKERYTRVAALTAKEAAGALPLLVGDASLTPILAEKQNIEMTLTAQTQKGLGPSNPEVLQTKALLTEINQKLEQRVADIKRGVQLDWEQAQAEAELFESRVKELEEMERNVSTGVARELDRLQKDIDTLKLRRQTLEARMDDERVNLALPKTSVDIREEATVPELPLPVSPNFALNVTLSVVAGLFFGVVLAFFVEYLDTTVKTVDDVERFLQSNVLGVIPQKIRALNDPNARSKHSEVYRVLRMNLKSQRNLGSGKVIVFTSASAGEGKSMTSFNTAWVCAECGEKTLIIDADLHHPRQHKILNHNLEPGMSNVLVGEATFDEAVKKTTNPNLDFLPAGRISGGSVFGLMDTDEMAQLFETVRSRYDRVVIDAPPMIGVSDTAQLTRMGDGVVMIVQHRKYPRSLCKRAKDSIIAMGGNFLGVVLNNVNAAHDSSSYYYEHQYYYYYYTKDEKGNRHRTRRASSHHHHDESSDSKTRS